MDVMFIKSYLGCVSKIMIEEKDTLIELDSIVGDGDLGLTMSDGFFAAYEHVKISDETDCGKMLYSAGKAMSTAVPSTMGTLMSSGLMNAGKALKGKQKLRKEDVSMMFEAYENGVSNRGKAKIGEKTFLDGFHPGVVAIKENVSKQELSDIALKAYEAAKQGYESTVGMLAVHGRAATRGEASRELKDPGAYVGMLLMKAFVECMKVQVYE